MSVTYETGFSVHDIAKLSISAEAKCLLMYSLSVPREWVWRRQHIQDFLNVGETRLRKVLSEMRKVGGLKIIREKDSTGKIVSTKMVVDVAGVAQKLAEADSHNDQLPYHGENHDDHFPQCGEQSLIDTNNNINNTTDDNNIINTNHNPVDNTNDQNQHHGGDVENKEVIDDAGRRLILNNDLRDQGIVDVSNIPEEMKGLKQWIYWRSEVKEAGKKPAKIPYADRGKFAKVNDPSTWHTFADVQDWREKGMTGIGFVLTEQDDFTIIDLDKCIDQHGNVTPFAMKCIEIFDSYTELSPSKTGFHIIVKGKAKAPVKRVDIEIYEHSRYMVMTGWAENDKPVELRQAEIDRAVSKFAVKRTAPRRDYGDAPKFNKGDFTMPDEIFGEGQRNNSLARWAGILNQKNLTEQEYFYYLHAINGKCCSPPLPEWEVRAIGQSIGRYN